MTPEQLLSLLLLIADLRLQINQLAEENRRLREERDHGNGHDDGSGQ